MVAMLALGAGNGFAQSGLQCHKPTKSGTTVELLFGRSAVSEAAWGRFLAREITPRFPDGLTVYDTRGQWRDPATGRISRELSRVVMIAVPGLADQERLRQIIEAYKTRFKQKSVGLIVRAACISF